MKKSCYIIIYSDYGFLDLLLTILYKNMDEIIIVDGPFDYCTPILKKLNLYYEEENSPIKSILNNYGGKIKYFYKNFKNEKEKRIFGYNQCSGDVVLLADSDELFSINNESIDKFYHSNKSVIGFDIYCMCRIDLAFNPKNQIHRMFKKKNINALEHLSYLWLVGVDGLLPRKTELIEHNDQVGSILHQTLNRTKMFSIIKYIFYTRLYKTKNKDHSLPLFCHRRGSSSSIAAHGDLYALDDLLQKYTIDDITTIFYHSRFPAINLPESNKNHILYRIPKQSIDLLKFNNNHNEAYFKQDSLVLQDLKYVFYLPKDHYKDNKINITFVTENIKECSVNLYDVCVNKKWDKYSYNQTVENDNFVIKQELNPEEGRGIKHYHERIDIAIEFICKTNVGIGGRIKSIKSI